MDEDSMAKTTTEFHFKKKLEEHKKMHINRRCDMHLLPSLSLPIIKHEICNSPHCSLYNKRKIFPATSVQMKVNSRYISKISSSTRKLQDPSLRMCPYFIPERSRTKSESTDAKTDIDVNVTDDSLHSSQSDTMMDTSCDNGNLTNNTYCATTTPTLVKLMKNCSLKKSKSLEDIRAKVVDGSLPSHEMEFVSSRIQKLKVQE